MAKKRRRKQAASDAILERVDRLIPGSHAFFERLEASKTFGGRIAEIRKELDRRFGKGGA